MACRGCDVPQRGFLCFVFLTAAVLVVKGQQLLAITNAPETGRRGDLYFYAIAQSSKDSDIGATCAKDGGLPSNIVESGVVEKDGTIFGCYLKVKESKRQRGLRYGRYTATYVTIPGRLEFGEAFVRPVTKQLDTRGVYTVTIYPEVDEQSSPLAEEISIGVKWTPGCQRIIWCKDNKRNIHTGPRLTLTSLEDSGLYTIQRPGRGQRGWFVQIRVIASPCRKENYFSESSGACLLGTGPCLNSGVLRPGASVCRCPPFFSGIRCECANALYGDFLLTRIPSPLSCGDLPGGHPKCKGYLICLGGHNGCKCAPGWWGDGCNKPCPKGKYGYNCEQKCPDEERDCDRFYGPVEDFCPLAN